MDPERAGRAIRIASEWLGSEHVVVNCLKIGIALHHADLPAVLQSAIEELIRDRVVRVTIASPTLAQGLNISVSSIVFSSIYRMQKVLDAREFLNVCGRAGRPYASAEGRIVFPFRADDPKERYYRKAWWDLVRSAGSPRLISGLFAAVGALLGLLASQGKDDPAKLFDYVLGVATVEEVATVFTDADAINANNLLDYLDEAIIALLGDSEALAIAISPKLSMRSSAVRFGNKELDRLAEPGKYWYRHALEARASTIWNSTSPEQRTKPAYLSGLPFRDAYPFTLPG